ncbi:acetate--CoA ligase family protein [Effusibacillus dendaii]|uniref:Acetyl-CoA synthetase n=1 Tax=Effusibacillus dendaii TaxID=2743772 RepID=A0A7I8D639_9BACL|nr:acetate--CoA ligase family protein [Effusibacillus dendaii]BCJ85613.1 acetyl-CoA synthetase [Effusibacillus dendaii]
MSNTKIRFIIEQAREEKRELLTEYESKLILSELGINTPPIMIAKTREEVAEKASSLGFPIVMKIHSPDIAHKSDIGCVVVGIGSVEESIEAYDKIMNSAAKNVPMARIQGVSVQTMADKDIEIIIGMKRDPVFGPTVLFGLGGIFVELIKDISLRVYPFTDQDVGTMIKEIKGYPLLRGYRGQQKRDIDAIKAVIHKIAELAVQVNEIQEIDLNPIFVYEKGICAVDARILLDFW